MTEMPIKSSLVFDGPSRLIVGKITVAAPPAPSTWQGKLAAGITDNKVRITSALNVAADLVLILSGAQFGSAFRMAGSTVAIGTTSLGMAFKPKEQSQADIEALQAMPLHERIRVSLQHAFKPNEHIRHTIGGGILTAGFLYVIAGQESHRFMESVYGANAMVGASMLLFTPKDNDAWRKFGAYMGVTTTPVGVGASIQGLQQHDPFPLLANVAFLASNAISFFASKNAAAKKSLEHGDIASVFQGEGGELRNKMMQELNKHVSITVLVTGQSAGQHHWAYVTMKPEQYLKFKEVQHSQHYDLSDYADTVIAHGIGEKPAPKVRRDMERNQGFNTNCIETLDQSIAASLQNRDTEQQKQGASR